MERHTLVEKASFGWKPNVITVIRMPQISYGATVRCSNPTELMPHMVAEIRVELNVSCLWNKRGNRFSLPLYYNISKTTFVVKWHSLVDPEVVETSLLRLWAARINRYATSPNGCFWEIRTPTKGTRNPCATITPRSNKSVSFLLKLRYPLARWNRLKPEAAKVASPRTGV